VVRENDHQGSRPTVTTGARLFLKTGRPLRFQRFFDAVKDMYHRPCTCAYRRSNFKDLPGRGAAAKLQGRAEELFVTPSAISHQIKALEEQLGREPVSNAACAH